MSLRVPLMKFFFKSFTLFLNLITVLLLVMVQQFLSNQLFVSRKTPLTFSHTKDHGMAPDQVAHPVAGFRLIDLLTVG